jgi:hypothetical protein
MTEEHAFRLTFGTGTKVTERLITSKCQVEALQRALSHREHRYS